MQSDSLLFEDKVGTETRIVTGWNARMHPQQMADGVGDRVRGRETKQIGVLTGADRRLQ